MNICFITLKDDFGHTKNIEYSLHKLELEKKTLNEI